MWIGVVTLFPEMFAESALTGIFARALKNEVLSIYCANPRDFTADKHRNVDDKPYGGGAGMVMQAEPLAAAVKTLQDKAPVANLPVVMLSPVGEQFSQGLAVEKSHAEGLILICGRYEGVDQRFIESCVDEVWSIGDYVLSGGELPALVVLDAIARHIPGVLGNIRSNLDESHLDGTLEYPQYTRPEISLNESVPEVILGGDHSEIGLYRRREALAVTYRERPDLLARKVFSERDRRLLEAYFADHQ